MPKVNFNENDLIIDESLSFKNQVEGYRKAYNKLLNAKQTAEQAKKEAETNDSLALYKEADDELDRITPFFLPFIAAHEQAQNLKSKGFKLSSWEGDISGPSGEEGKDVDPIVALMLIVLEAVVDELLNKVIEEIEEGDLTFEDVYNIVSGVIILQAVRDAIIPPDDNGEIAKLLRDPLKRPVEIIKNWRDKIISPDDNGEIARIIRDPIKRPVEVVKKVIRKLFG